MNPFIALIWEVISDCPDFLERLRIIMQQDYKPFLSGEQAFQANAKALECHIREELAKWYDWLPDTPINRIDGGLALEMLDSVDWDQLARLVQEQTLRTNLTGLRVLHASGNA